MRVLLVEDDRMIGESVEESLRHEGYAVDWVTDGEAASLALGNQSYDAVLLDLGLPRRHGLEVLSRYRSSGGTAPVLIITARDGVTDRVRGLDAGADDYLIKPFDLEELFARLRAMIRRRTGRGHPQLSYRGLILDPATHDATFNGQPLTLSAREFQLLLALMDPPGAVVSRAALQDKLYGWNREVESNTVEVYIHALRRKLGRGFVTNVRGVGYKLAKDANDPPC